MPWANKPLKAEDIKYIIAHCSAGPVTQKAADIVKYHEHRWPSQHGMSYAHFIEADGSVVKGRDELSLGFHAGNLNDCAIGFCAAGGVEVVNGKIVVKDNFTDAQRKSIAAVALGMMARYPNAKLIGHNEVCTKACPVYDIHAIVRDCTGRTTNATSIEEAAKAGDVLFWKTIKNFNSSEFEFVMDQNFITQLDSARTFAAIPFVIRDAEDRKSCNIRSKNLAIGKLIAESCIKAGLVAQPEDDGVVYVKRV